MDKIEFIPAPQPFMVTQRYLREKHDLSEFRELAQRNFGLASQRDPQGDLFQKSAKFMQSLDEFSDFISQLPPDNKRERYRAENAYKSAVALATNPDFKLARIDWLDKSFDLGMAAPLGEFMLSKFALRLPPFKNVRISFDIKDLPKVGIEGAVFLLKYYYAEQGKYNIFASQNPELFKKMMLDESTPGDLSSKQQEIESQLKEKSNS